MSMFDTINIVKFSHYKLNTHIHTQIYMKKLRLGLFKDNTFF